MRWTSTKVTIHNGKKARFWTSSWINGIAPATLFLGLYKHSQRKNRSMAEEIADDQQIRDIVHGITIDLLRDYFQLWELIEEEELHLPVSSKVEDEITWTMTSKGEYTSGSTYNLQFEGGTLSIFPTLIWHNWATPHCK